MAWIKSKSGFFPKWALVIILAFVVGDLFGQTRTTVIVAPLILILMGIFEWVVLRQQMPGFTVWWVLATIIGWIAIEILNLTGLPLYVFKISISLIGYNDVIADLAIMGAELGLAIGIGQWLILRRQPTMRSPFWWVIANVVAFMLAIPVIVFVRQYTEFYFNSPRAFNLFLSLVGHLLYSVIEAGVVGLITGYAIVNILWISRHAQVESPSTPVINQPAVSADRHE